VRSVNTDEILEAFELLPEWDARYEFISDLGKGLAPMPQGDKTDQNRVRGCNTPA
jgi:cysteine desulfuration protein SufE